MSTPIQPVALSRKVKEYEQALLITKGRGKALQNSSNPSGSPDVCLTNLLHHLASEPPSQEKDAFFALLDNPANNQMVLDLLLSTATLVVEEKRSAKAASKPS